MTYVSAAALFISYVNVNVPVLNSATAILLRSSAGGEGQEEDEASTASTPDVDDVESTTSRCCKLATGDGRE